MASFRSALSLRTGVTALVAVMALAFAPGIAAASQPASLRLLGTDPEYVPTVITMPNGTTFRGSPGLFRLRITPTGGVSSERLGFCADALHALKGRTDYSVVLRTADDEPALASPRYAEAAWLLQQAEALIAAAPAADRPLEAGALQLAIWQLTDQARESAPTPDAALNARAAALRALASGRAIGGAMTLIPSMPRGCAGRSSVALRLTGVPGSSATLRVTSGPGTVSPAEVRFAADGTADATVTSASPGVVNLAAHSEGGTLTRVARARSGQSTPQETLVLVGASFEATASVTFDDCPLIPFEGDTSTPTGPGTPTAPPSTPVSPFETPASKPETPGAPTTPPGRALPHRPSQSGPSFDVTKTGPATARAGDLVRYAITVVNRGTTALRQVTLADDLPTGMSLTATPAGSQLRSGRLVWSIAPIAPGASRTVRVTARIDADAAGRRCNRATASAPGAASRTATSCVRIAPIGQRTVPAVTG